MSAPTCIEASADGALACASAVEVDFADPPSWAEYADRVKEMVDRGVRHKDIARDLDIHKTWPGKALAHWYAERGIPAPDGRAARGRLEIDPADLALRDRAKGLYDGGLPMQDIAAELGCCRDRVTALIRAWHDARGLETPDGRTRRKTLGDKAADMAE